MGGREGRMVVLVGLLVSIGVLPCLLRGSELLEHSSCSQWPATVVLKPMTLRWWKLKMGEADPVVFPLNKLDILSHPDPIGEDLLPTSSGVAVSLFLDSCSHCGGGGGDWEFHCARRSEGFQAELQGQVSRFGMQERASCSWRRPAVVFLVDSLRWLKPGAKNLDAVCVLNKKLAGSRISLHPARSGRLGGGKEDGIRGSVLLCQDFAVVSPEYFKHTFDEPMEIVKFDPGSFQHAAQNLSCSIWNHQFGVILWNQGNINMIHTNILSLRGWTTDSLVTNIGEVLIAELKSYLHNSYKALMQIVGSDSFTIEQDLFSKFSCT